MTVDVATRMARMREAKAAKRAQKIGGSQLPTDGTKALLELIRLKVENHLTEHWLKEEALRPKPWIYRCSVRGCGETFTLPAPEDRVGQPAPKCPTHGAVELYPVSTPVAGYGNEG